MVQLDALLLCTRVSVCTRTVVDSIPVLTYMCEWARSRTDKEFFKYVTLCE